MSDHAAREQTTASSADRTRPVSAPHIQDIIAAVKEAVAA